MKGELESQLKSLNALLLCANAQKYKLQRKIKAIENQVDETKNKIATPVTALGLLEDNVIESASQMFESCCAYMF